jgi:hypothetical protein
MIRLTGINHAPLLLNADMIEHVEITPDTRDRDERPEIHGGRIGGGGHSESKRRGIANLPEVVEASDGARDAGLAQSANYGRTTEKLRKESPRPPSRQAQAGLRHHRWNSPGIRRNPGRPDHGSGKIKDLSQITVAFIVLGETFGAVMVSTPA